MQQQHAWNKEYKEQVFLSNSDVPQLDVRKFWKWARKQGLDSTQIRVLDLGSGTGKNAIYFSGLGADVTAIEFAPEAMRIAKDNANNAGEKITFIQGSIGTDWPVPAGSFDIVLDVLASNSLSVTERQKYLSELIRVLKPGGIAFVKIPALEGDKHAERLLKDFPADEPNTYLMPQTGIVEHVASREELNEIYEGLMLQKVERKASYTIFNGKPYRRQFWVIYLQKLVE